MSLVTLTVTDDAGCQEELSFTVSVASPDGFQDQRATTAITVYPNPFNDWLSVRLEVDETSVVSLSVYDLLGKLMCQELNVQGGGDHVYGLNVDAFLTRSGIYFLKIRVGDDGRTVKLTRL